MSEKSTRPLNLRTGKYDDRAFFNSCVYWWLAGDPPAVKIGSGANPFYRRINYQEAHQVSRGRAHVGPLPDDTMARISWYLHTIKTPGGVSPRKVELLLHRVMMVQRNGRANHGTARELFLLGDRSFEQICHVLYWAAGRIIEGELDGNTIDPRQLTRERYESARALEASQASRLTAKMEEIYPRVEALLNSEKPYFDKYAEKSLFVAAGAFRQVFSKPSKLSLETIHVHKTLELLKAEISDDYAELAYRKDAMKSLINLEKLLLKKKERRSRPSG